MYASRSKITLSGTLDAGNYELVAFVGDSAETLAYEFEVVPEEALSEHFDTALMERSLYNEYDDNKDVSLQLASDISSDGM